MSIDFLYNLKISMYDYCAVDTGRYEILTIYNIKIIKSEMIVYLFYVTHDLRDSCTFYRAAHPSRNSMMENISGFKTVTFFKTEMSPETSNTKNRCIIQL